MNNKKLAFGMNYKEFCKLYENIECNDDEMISDTPLKKKGETFIEFLEKGGHSLIKENSDIVKKLI